MFDQRERLSPRGCVELLDFLVPVHYGVGRCTLPAFAPKDDATAATRGGPGIDTFFVGRDHEFLGLERALLGVPSAIVVQGLTGVGKTALAGGFTEWLRDTGGAEEVSRFSFAEIAHFEYVLNRSVRDWSVRGF